MTLLEFMTDSYEIIAQVFWEETVDNIKGFLEGNPKRILPDSR